MRVELDQRIATINVAIAKLRQTLPSTAPYVKTVLSALRLLRPLKHEEELSEAQQATLSLHFLKLHNLLVQPESKDQIQKVTLFPLLTPKSPSLNEAQKAAIKKQRSDKLAEIYFNDVKDAPGLGLTRVITHHPHHNFRYYHPAERPERLLDLVALITTLQSRGLIEHHTATASELKVAPHSSGIVSHKQQRYLTRMLNLSVELERSLPLDDPGDTTYDKATNEARLANHAAVEAAVSYIFADDRSRQRTAQFLPLAPPAHHACEDRAHGYCIDNHTFALFVKILETRLAQSPRAAVLIVDCDFHDGDGTRRMLRRYIRAQIAKGRTDIDKRIRFVNFFARSEFPHNKNEPEPPIETTLAHVFKNIAYTARKTDDAAFTQLIRAQMSLLRTERFHPTDIVVSLGCDAHKDDYPGGQLTEYSYEYLARALVEYSKLNFDPTASLSVVFEGGYKSETNARCVAGFLRQMAAFHNPRLEFRVTAPATEISQPHLHRKRKWQEETASLTQDPTAKRRRHEQSPPITTASEQHTLFFHPAAPLDFAISTPAPSTAPRAPSS